MNPRFFVWTKVVDDRLCLKPVSFTQLQLVDRPETLATQEKFHLYQVAGNKKECNFLRNSAEFAMEVAYQQDRLEAKPEDEHIYHKAGF